MRETNSYKENLLSLNLNQMALHLDEVLDFGIQSGASLTEVLVKLTNHEIDIQEQQKTHRMIRSAALPSPKRLDTFDFSFQPSLNGDQIADLHSLRFIERNENANGLLREFFPKGTDFSKVTHDELVDALAKINGRPRKCLNWKTAHEVFTEEVLRLI